MTQTPWVDYVIDLQLMSAHAIVAPLCMSYHVKYDGGLCGLPYLNPILNELIYVSYMFHTFSHNLLKW